MVGTRTGKVCCALQSQSQKSGSVVFSRRRREDSCALRARKTKSLKYALCSRHFPKIHGCASVARVVVTGAHTQADESNTPYERSIPFCFHENINHLDHDDGLVTDGWYTPILPSYKPHITHPNPHIFPTRTVEVTGLGSASCQPSPRSC